VLFRSLGPAHSNTMLSDISRIASYCLFHPIKNILGQGFHYAIQNTYLLGGGGGGAGN
jgi:hypothetical protein